MDKDRNIHLVNKDSGEEVELSQTTGIIAFFILLPIVIVIELIKGFWRLIFNKD